MVDFNNFYFDLILERIEPWGGLDNFESRSEPEKGLIIFELSTGLEMLTSYNGSLPGLNAKEVLAKLCNQNASLELDDSLLRRDEELESTTCPKVKHQSNFPCGHCQIGRAKLESLERHVKQSHVNVTSGKKRKHTDKRVKSDFKRIKLPKQSKCKMTNQTVDTARNELYSLFEQFENESNSIETVERPFVRFQQFLELLKVSV